MKYPAALIFLDWYAADPASALDRHALPRGVGGRGRMNRACCSREARGRSSARRRSSPSFRRSRTTRRSPAAGCRAPSPGKFLYTGSDGIVLGAYDPQNQVIYVNSSQFDADAKYGGDAQALVTACLHEGRHAYQHQAVRGLVRQADPAQVALWKDNLADGHYISFRQDPRAYYQQPVEADARRFAEEKYAQPRRAAPGAGDAGGLRSPRTERCSSGSWPARRRSCRRRLLCAGRRRGGRHRDALKGERPAPPFPRFFPFAQRRRRAQIQAR